MHNLEYLRDKAHRLTECPGVYLMKNSAGEIIYVGKAKVLKNRVSSYFRNLSSHNDKVRTMVSHIFDFDFIVTDTEFEALVLECSLIKQYSPRYNILLKDDKGYHYIKVSNEEYPRITAAKQKENDGAMYIGPYISSFVVKQAVEEANRVFRLPTCSKKFCPSKKRMRPCLNYYIEQCSGACMGKLSRQEYRETVEQAVEYIKSGSHHSVERMKRQMQQAAERLDYEHAMRLRDRILAIEKSVQAQKIYLSHDQEADVIASAVSGDDLCFAILKFRSGHMVDKDDYIFADVTDFAAAREDFIAHYYNKTTDIPKLVLVDNEHLNTELFGDFLTQQAGKKVRVFFPQRGERKRLVDMAYANAAEQLASKLKRGGREIAALQELADLLGLSKPPAYIEAYDISNLGDTGIVGGMVVFENGVPARSLYRKFSIKNVNIQDDYSSMREMLERRICRYEQEKDQTDGFGQLPDIVLIDGGKGHIQAVETVFSKHNFPAPYYGMVKDSRHRTRALVGPQGEISISLNKAAFALLTRIQDEVHRYTVSYQRIVRKKSAFEMELTRIQGIGEKKAMALMKHFKTRAALCKADVAEIAGAAKITPQKAEEIKTFLNHLY